MKELEKCIAPPEPTRSPWKVYFDGNFWGHSGRQRAGKEFVIQKQFVWNDRVWHIPSVYVCGKGLVVDFCVQAPIQHVRDFIDKWELSLENDGADFTDQQQMQIEAENPMAIHIHPEIICNGKTISTSHGCGLSWNPCFAEQNGTVAQGIIKHYKLDPTSGWGIWRSAFPWQTVRKPAISSLKVIIKHESLDLYGSRFCETKPGTSIEIISPITGAPHTLTIQECEQQQMPADCFRDKGFAYPTHYTVMSYTLQPDLPDGSFSICDAGHGDHPRKEKRLPNEPQGAMSCAVGIIGGADGPTAIAFGSCAQEKLRAACSALRFNPVDNVEWQMVFYKQPCDDITIHIL